MIHNHRKGETMKRIIYPILALSLALLACDISINITPTPPPAATEPPVATEPPLPTEPPAPVTNVSCNELSLYLDPALASGYSCETIPESPYEMELYPAHTELTLQGYLLTDKFFEPHISIYPVGAYTALLPDFIPERVSALQALIGGAAPGTDSLPFLPTFNAGQVFHAQYQGVPFANGRGIRFITLYAQYTAPINNHDLFYTFQGLTHDGQYWVSLIMPITHAILPASSENPPGGMSWEDFSNNYGTYIADITNQLNAQPASSFFPNIADLDALVSSITITP
jgi:hypothetical protein